mgnify:CR=1 FL=1
MIDQRLETKLGFDKIRRIVSDRTLTEYASDKVASEEFSTDASIIRQRLNLTDEMRLVMMFEESFPTTGYIDAIPFLEPLQHPGTSIDTLNLAKLKTVIDTTYGVREFVNDRNTSYVVPVEVTANGALYSSVPTYGFFNLSSGSKTLFYGDGEVTFTGGRFSSSEEPARWNNTPEIVSGSVVFETRVSARCTTYGKPANWVPGYTLMVSANGSYEFLSDNFSTGIVEVAGGTLKTAQIGQGNAAGAPVNASRLGYGDILLTSAGRMFYTGAGEESDKPIVLADSVAAYTTPKPSYSSIGVVEQAGTGLLRMTSPVRVDCASATLRLASSVFAGAFVIFYCLRRHPTSRTHPQFRLAEIKEILGFFGWQALGSVAGLLKGNGIVILLAVYVGSAGCAAYEVSGKFAVLLWGLITNYRMAYLPGIVKAWSAGDREAFVFMTHRAFGWSLLGMTMVVTPIVMFASEICCACFGEPVPDGAPMFLRAVALQFFFEALATPYDTAILASGRIALYEIVLTALLSTSFFLAWAFLASGLPAWTATGAVAVVNVFAFLYRFVHLRLVRLPDGTRAWFVRCAS